MCRMTDTGARWKREIELPPFGGSARYLAVPYRGETRYIASPEAWCDAALADWLKPMYAVRVTALKI